MNTEQTMGHALTLANRAIEKLVQERDALKTELSVMKTVLAGVKQDEQSLAAECKVLRDALEKVLNCITETRGVNADAAVFAARAALGASL